jgi:hypothetical protein
MCRVSWAYIKEFIEGNFYGYVFLVFPCTLHAQRTSTALIHNIWLRELVRFLNPHISHYSCQLSSLWFKYSHTWTAPLHSFHLCSRITERTNYTKQQYLLITTNFTKLSLPEKPPAVQLPKNFPASYGTQMFITVFTRVPHRPLS